MWKDFKEFAFKGNVLDLAVAVILGAAIGKIVTSVVDNLLMPVIGALLGGLDFNSLSVTIGHAVIAYGLVIQACVDFIIIAFFIFLIIRAVSKISHSKKDEAPSSPSETELLAEIRDLLKKQSD